MTYTNSNPASGEQPATTWQDNSAAGQIETLRSDRKFLEALQSPLPSQHQRAAQARWDALHVAAEAERKAQPAEANVTAYQVPASPADYQLPAPMTDSTAPLGDADAQEFRQFAHQVGLDQDDFSFLASAGQGVANGLRFSEEDCVLALISSQRGKEGAEATITKAQNFLRGLPPAQRDKAVEWLETSGLGKVAGWSGDLFCRWYIRRRDGHLAISRT